MHKLSPFFALLGATVCLWGGVAGASDAKTTLVRDAVVDGKSIYLSDLLPESSPRAVRIPAREILIARSPQPGSIRVLSSGEIARLLNGGDLLNQVVVPEQVVVHRLGHLVTREEVANAIRKTLGRNPGFSSAQIAPEDIRLSARVTTLAEDPDLHVTRIELDRSLREIKFWLVSGAEPTLLPFIATTQSNLQPGFEMQSPGNLLGRRSEMDSGSQSIPAPALVEAGKLARLHLVSGTEMQMDLTAVSLERGTLGQNVRAKIQNTGKIISTRVVGRNRLEAQF